MEDLSSKKVQDPSSISAKRKRKATEKGKALEEHHNGGKSKDVSLPEKRVGPSSQKDPAKKMHWRHIYQEKPCAHGLLGWAKQYCLACGKQPHKPPKPCAHGLLGWAKRHCLVCGNHPPKKSKSKRTRKRCEHDKIPCECVECGGSSLCVHGRRLSHCKHCGGSSRCVHNTMSARIALTILRRK